MKTGFVFGKYYPFHLGHKAKVDFALAQCDLLYVVVCASDRETIEGQTRVQWIEDSFPEEPRLKVVCLNYSEEDLPNTSVSSEAVSQVWAQKFKEIVPDADLLFTSEEYGEFVAGYMGIEHISFDPERKAVPVSASQIRNAPFRYWHFLPPPVQKFYQLKICFLGTECTGKSSISRALHRGFDSSLVEEAGRELIEDSNDFKESDLYEVAAQHAHNIALAQKKLQPFVFIDTDIHITQSYAKHFFGNYLRLPESFYALNRADIYIYLDNDFEFTQDGTRLSEPERNHLDQQHRKTLKKFGIDYYLVDGSWEERLEKVKEIIDSTVSDMSR